MATHLTGQTNTTCLISKFTARGIGIFSVTGVEPSGSDRERAARAAYASLGFQQPFKIWHGAILSVLLFVLNWYLVLQVGAYNGKLLF
jgi:hypothetical protein